MQVIFPEQATDYIGELLPRLFPRGVSAAAVPLSDQIFPLYRGEEPAVINAVEKRRMEFAAGRHCARIAMTRLGHAACAVPSGTDRSPIWPPGLVGSITHDTRVCAAVVASSCNFRSIGIDTEMVASVAPEMAADILRQDEASELDHHVRPDGADWLTLFFCLKEAAYKAFYPVFRRTIDFHEMRIRVQPQTREFFAESPGSSGGGEPNFRGRYRVERGRILAACW